MEWFAAKVKGSVEINGKIIVSVENIMSKKDQSKHFVLNKSPDDTRDIFQDKIISKIAPPKLLMRPKNVYSIKEFDKIEKKMKKNSAH